MQRRWKRQRAWNPRGSRRSGLSASRCSCTEDPQSTGETRDQPTAVHGSAQGGRQKAPAVDATGGRVAGSLRVGHQAEHIALRIGQACHIAH